MKDFAYCFMDLAKVFNCYDPNTHFSYNLSQAVTKNRKHELIARLDLPHSDAKSMVTSKLGRIEEYVKPSTKVNNTLEHEISSTNHQSVATNSISGEFYSKVKNYLILCNNLRKFYFNFNEIN